MEELPVELKILVCNHLSIAEYLRLFSANKALYENRVPYYGRHYLLNNTQFELCCRKGKIEYIDNLLQTDLYDPLLVLVKFGLDPFVEHLMTQCDPSKGHNQALKIAAENGHLSTVKLLLSDPRVEPCDWALVAACDNGHTNVVQFLLRLPQIDPSDCMNMPIQRAAFRGYLDIVHLLLKDPRVDPSANHNCAIRAAASCGHASVCELLLCDSRVNPAALSNWALRKACENGHKEVVLILLQDTRVNPNDMNAAAIRSAKRFGHFSIVNILKRDPRQKLLLGLFVPIKLI
ncbi:ankyrin repeat-containing domain protein [Gorgonomyces haynaldii]|nr:ankyrin repeat-containing domain protein [Gorgonomyces haynaldii]